MNTLNLTRLKRIESPLNRIKYVENFCSEDFCNRVLDEVGRRRGMLALLADNHIDKNTRDADEVNFSGSDPIILELRKKFRNALIDYEKELEILNFIDARKLELETSIITYTNQKGYIPHIDSCYVSRDSTYRLFSIVAYFNDDYLGGDIYFPNLGFTLKPKKGSCLIFPSDNSYLHGVKPVIGQKVISPCWFHIKANEFNVFDPTVV